jgi:hypothetical protein
MQPDRTPSAASDHDGVTPVFLFAHDYGTHLPYCEILQVETSIKCTCGFKEALEAALESEALSRV